MPIAVDRACRLRGLTLTPGDVWVVGDTANDLACARAGGVRCLLVATGGASLDELAVLVPDAVLADLSDTNAAARILLGG